MIARDGDRCPWPWCDRPATWSDGHHLIWSTRGGPTTVITTDAVEDRKLLVDAMGLPLHRPESVEGSDYVFSDAIPGAKHFGAWPLSEAAESCFGTST